MLGTTKETIFEQNSVSIKAQLEEKRTNSLKYLKK
jgi:hypothetical protein